MQLNSYKIRSLEDGWKFMSKEEKIEFFENREDIKLPTFIAFGLCQNLSEFYLRIKQNKKWIGSLRNERNFPVEWDFDLYAHKKNLQHFIDCLTEIIIFISKNDPEFYEEVIDWSIDKNIMLINELIFWE